MKKDSYKESLKEYLLTYIPTPMLNTNVGLITKNGEHNNWFSMNLGETIEILEEDELFFLKNHINALFSNYKELEKKILNYTICLQWHYLIMAKKKVIYLAISSLTLTKKNLQFQ